MMASLGQNYSSTLDDDRKFPEIGQSMFKKFDWAKFYQCTKDTMLINAPEPRGKEVEKNMFLDSHHAQHA